MKKFLLLNFFCLLVFGAMANELFDCTPSEILDNRSFETGATHDGQSITDWFPFGPVFTLDENVIGTAQDGQFFLKMFSGNAGVFQDHAITPGDNLTASVYVQNASFDPMQPGCTGFIKLEYFNAGGGFVGVTESTKLDNTLPQDTWTQITLNDVVPAGAAKVRMVVIMQCSEGGGAVMFDNASLIGCPPAEPTSVPVTFCVDLECFAVSDAVAVAFGFNGFAPVNALSDPDGDRTYCGTFDMPVGELEYKFFFSQQQFENLAGAGDCVNENNNRTLTVVEGPPQTVLFGWESCEDNCPAPPTADITFCVNLDCFPQTDGVAVVGSFNGFNPATNSLSDQNGDGTYCGTVAVPVGEQEFKFFFSQQQFENLAGAGDCLNGNNNRTITVVEDVPQTVTFGWGSCDENCVPVSSDVEFCVDMTCYDGEFTNVYVSGSVNGWCGDCWLLTDPDGDNVYCGTFNVPFGNVEYKFTVDNWSDQEQFAGGEECTLTTGPFVNRFFVHSPEVTTQYFGWEICTESDEERPTISCPDNYEVFTDQFTCLADIDLLAAEAMDPCLEVVEGRVRPVNPETLANIGPWLSPWSTSVSEELAVGTYRVRWRALDRAGNRRACNYFVTVSEELPCPWVQLPDGVGCEEGSQVSYDDGTFTLSSYQCHNPVTSNSDEYAFVQQTLCGNGEIIAQVTSISGNAGGWAGVIMRESNDPSAKSVAYSTNLSSSHRREARATTGGTVLSQLLPSFGRHWLRLQRVGNQVRAYSSFNGSSWFLRFAQTIPMAECLEVGLVLNSAVGSGEMTATFDNVSVSGGGMQMFNANPGLTDAASQNSRSFTAYPNPTNGAITLALGDFFDKEANIEVVNTFGQVVFQRQLGAIDHATEELDLSNLPAGVYIVRMNMTNGETEMIQVVKQ